MMGFLKGGSPQLKGGSRRPPFEVLYPYLIVTFTAYCLADLAVLSMREYMLPSQVPPTKIKTDQLGRTMSRGALNTIVSRNFFSFEPRIPDPLQLKGGEKGAPGEKEAPPVPSSLPLNLMGTIVHSNPEKSLANVEVTSKNTVLPFRVNQDIENMATLISVERGKIIIRNMNSGRLEYIELKEKSKLNFMASKPSSPVPRTEIRPAGQNRFEVSRSEIMRQTADLPSFLNTAAVQPRKKPNGEIDGFKFLMIQPGSAIANLGFQVGDVIKAVNGEPVTDAAQAMSLYQNLRSANNVKITVERGGREEEFDYTVK